MKDIIITILLIFINISLYSANSDGLLKILDQEIGKRDEYMNIKESKIDSLRKLIKKDIPLGEEYRINKQIFEEYHTYKYDSAMYYIARNKEIADFMENNKYKDEVRISQSQLLSTAGLINESITNISQLDRSKLDNSLLLIYYETMESIYYTAKNYSNDSIYTPQYEKIERAYIDSVYSLLPEGSINQIYYSGYKRLVNNQLEEAKEILLNLLENLPENVRLYAIICSNLATINRLQDNNRDYEKYLILAAISDQICALKENSAMQRLAIFLSQNKPEELTRAYQYINYSMEDASFYNSRLRTVQVAQNMPIIIKAYQLKSEEENRNLRASLIIISILLLVLIGLLTYVYRQVQIVKKNRKELYTLNNQLNKLNNNLQSANRIREESISLFIDLSSSYLNKMDSFRETVKRKILAKQIDDLYSMSTTTESIQSVQDTFLQTFDNAFLRLYPDFLEEFNKLLSDEGKVKLKKGELLNSELRVFALIKLGIRDSSKIASFLHFSPQTIYNYRNKVKNYSIVDRNNFEKYVQEIGEIM
ncbi:hypothetical protein GGR21_003315 [Dysgonomonas hofstadii]|uniref:DUF6377 domain-containing protein n=1 Tax=Dysgonomonas hofstadii TaxID=637886 RepID=A0A840CTC3_9BACT|nr:DUF6377 domain-containing protein [Dysgonomonas hofstadii]MBB4037398.1 hypothetical protein [Dysgonomonas hofstadii]